MLLFSESLLSMNTESSEFAFFDISPIGSPDLSLWFPSGYEIYMPSVSTLNQVPNAFCSNQNTSGMNNAPLHIPVNQEPQPLEQLSCAPTVQLPMARNGVPVEQEIELVINCLFRLLPKPRDNISRY
jgi:hypothetical protein